MLEIAGAVSVGFIGAFLGTMSGGGGLLTIPYLLLTGMPVDIAIATNRMGGLGMLAGSLGNFYKSKKINWKLIPIFGVLAVAGGFIGANLVLNIDKNLLETIAGLLLLLLIPTIFLKKNFGIKEFRTGPLKKGFGLILYSIGMVFAGFFGAGAGIFLNYIIVNFFGLTFVKAIATDMVAWSFMSVVSFSIFAFNGLVNYRIGAAMAVGSLLGGYLGSKTAIEKGDGFVKAVLAFVILATSAKLLIF